MCCMDLKHLTLSQHFNKFEQFQERQRNCVCRMEKALMQMQTLALSIYYK